MKRPHRVAVRLSDDELARLDELRPRGVPRATFVRQLLREPAPPDVATHQEVLGVLTSLARDSSVTAAVALERAWGAVRLEPAVVLEPIGSG